MPPSMTSLSSAEQVTLIPSKMNKKGNDYATVFKQITKHDLTEDINSPGLMRCPDADLLYQTLTKSGMDRNMTAAHYKGGHHPGNDLGLHYTALPPIVASCPYSDQLLVTRKFWSPGANRPSQVSSRQRAVRSVSGMPSSRKARRSAILRRLEVDKQIERSSDRGHRLDRRAVEAFRNAGDAPEITPKPVLVAMGPGVRWL
jgi:hypothetical protein